MNFSSRCRKHLQSIGMTSGVILAGLIFISQQSVALTSSTGISGVAALFASESNAKTADTLYRMARNEIRAGNAEQGKMLLQQVLVLNPLHKEAKAELKTLASQGESIAAQPDVIASGGAIESLNATQLMDVARTQMSEGDYADAKTTLVAALQKDPTKKEKEQIDQYIAAIDSNEEKASMVRKAEQDYNLTEIDKQINKALLYMENAQYDKAEIELNRARLINPDDKRVLTLIAQVDKQRGQVAQSQAAASSASDEARAKEIHATADVLFKEGVALYRQNQVIEAFEKWQQAIAIDPGHQVAQTYITNTRLEYEQAVEARAEAEKMAAEEAKYEEMLDTPVRQYSTQGELIDVKDVLSTLSAFTNLNIVMDDNLAGNVSLEMKNTTLREILNVLQKQYGFVWNREGNTIFVEPGFSTRVFALNEGQYKTIEAIINDPTSLQDSSQSLRSILYGPLEEFKVPGKQLYLNQSTRSLVVTDTLENQQKVEAFLEAMPALIGENKPVDFGVYKLRKESAREMYQIVRLVLYDEAAGYDVRDPRRRLVLEEETSTLIVIDYPENIQKVEQTLNNQELSMQVEEGGLEAQQFPVTDPEDLDDTPEALARREEFVNTIAEVIRNMLYGVEGIDAAALQGRQVFVNPDRGTIDVIDTPTNLRKVDNYLNSIRGESTQDILIKKFPIKHVSVYDISDALSVLFFDQTQSTRTTFISQNAVQTIGTDQQGTQQDIGNLFENTTRDRFNLTGGGGGGADLLQFFDIRYYPEANTNSIVLFTTDQEVLDIVSRVITTFDQPQRMVELEQRIVDVSLNDLRSINFDYVLTNPLLEPISFNPENMDMGLGVSPGAFDDVNSRAGIEFSMHTFGASRLDFVMNLLETTSSFQVLNAPKILSISNPITPPQLFVGQQIPYADSVDFEDQGDDDPTNNRLTAQFQVALAGSSLIFLPFILNDNHIYVEIAPNVTTPGERLPVQLTGDAPPGQEPPSIGPLTFTQKYVNTSVRIKDGTTLVIGGLIDEKEDEQINKTPFLSKIPFLGTLFTDRRVEKTKTSTIMFITVRIINPEFD